MVWTRCPGPPQRCRRRIKFQYVSLESVIALIALGIGRARALDEEIAAIEKRIDASPEKTAADWTMLARGLGVEASRATTNEEFAVQLEDAMRVRGPRLIEVVL